MTVVDYRTRAVRPTTAVDSGPDDFARLCNALPSGIIGADDQGIMTFVNPAAIRIFGGDYGGMRGKSLQVLFPEALLEEQPSVTIGALLESGDSPVLDRLVEVTARKLDGTPFPAKVGFARWDTAGHRYFCAVVIDITERRASEARLQNLAHIDQLTQLNNRVRFFELATNAVGRFQSSAVLLLDLDGFKDVNDTLGHMAGDILLQAIGKRLSSVAPPGTIIGRLGGDEFVLCCPGYSAEAAAELATDLRHVVADPFQLHGEEVTIDLSIGIAISPGNGTSIQMLLANADVALYQVKSAGGGAAALFEPELRTDIDKRRRCQNDLRRAVELDQFEIYWQPQVALAKRRIIGAEALLRWRHPTKGILEPGTFLPTLDQMALSVEVGDWVLRSALSQAQVWARSGLPPIRVAINLFQAQLREGRLADRVLDALAEFDIAPTQLDIEITETVAIKEHRHLVPQLNRLRGAGVGIAFDDFGTGYASLSLLKRFPVSMLKVDQIFVRHMETDARDRAIVEAILKLGETFGVEVIAEGVETIAQEQLLTKLGCSLGQGYLYGRPLPASTFEKLLDPGSGIRNG